MTLEEMINKLNEYPMDAEPGQAVADTGMAYSQPVAVLILALQKENAELRERLDRLESVNVAPSPGFVEAQLNDGGQEALLSGIERILRASKGD